MTRVCSLLLNLVIGLLSSTIVGVSMSVWVSVICCRRLLDSLLGHCLLRFASFSCNSVIRMDLVLLGWCLWCLVSLNVMPLVMARLVNRALVRNIIVTLCCVVGMLSRE